MVTIVNFSKKKLMVFKNRYKKTVNMSDSEWGAIRKIVH